MKGSSFPLGPVIVCFIVSAGSSAQAATITLKQGVNGYTGCSDTYIDAENPNVNSGSQWYMHLYMSTHDPERSDLIRFNLAGQIPSGQTIVSATLYLWVYQLVDMTSGDWLDVAPYRVGTYRDWQETQATWNVFKTNTYWGLPGCEYVPSDRSGTYDGQAVRFTRDSAVNRYYSWDVTASVQAWYSGQQNNNGWLIRGVQHDGGTDGISFNAKESGSADYRPYLEITYVPEPASLILFAFAPTLLRRRR